MKWNSTTVPTHVEERHELSILLGKAFAQSYAIHSHCEQTTQLLDMYRNARRMVDRENGNLQAFNLNSPRYGAYDAYLATQG